jgi:hypothetical protein
MQTPEHPVESILARLMPPALSDGAVRDIEAMLDELAGSPPAPEVVEFKPRHQPWSLKWIAGGIAAAGVAAALVFPVKPAAHPVASDTAGTAPEQFVLVGESERIESTADEGWVENSDGSAMQALRLTVVEENRFVDQETGIEMKISEPREELLLMPVSTF